MKIPHTSSHTLPNGGQITFTITMNTDAEGHAWMANAKIMNITSILHTAAEAIAKLSEDHEPKE